MADLILDGLHSVTGMCDWCGQECDPTAHDLNALDCSFKDCPPSVYHQECLEKFFKTNRLDKNRKTGFTCPRGRGKGSQCPQPCPGKIEKSHPILARSDLSKKRRKAAPPPPPPPPPKAAPKAEDAGKERKGLTPLAPPPAAAAAKAPLIMVKNLSSRNLESSASSPGTSTLTPLGKPPTPSALQTKMASEAERLRQAALSARREIGLAGGSGADRDRDRDRDEERGAAPSAWARAAPSGPPAPPVPAAAPTLAAFLSPLIDKAASKPPSSGAVTGALSNSSSFGSLTTLGGGPGPKPMDNVPSLQGVWARPKAAEESEKPAPPPGPQLTTIGSLAGASRGPTPKPLASPSSSSPNGPAAPTAPLANGAPALPSASVAQFQSALAMAGQWPQPPGTPAGAADRESFPPPGGVPPSAALLENGHGHGHDDGARLGIVGGDYEDDSASLDGDLAGDRGLGSLSAASQALLTKAQKKNLKRAEKKAQRRAMEGVTTASETSLGDRDADDGDLDGEDGGYGGGADYLGVPPPVAPAPPSPLAFPLSLGGGDDELQGRVLEAVIHHKIAQQIVQLQQIGFAEWQAIAAVCKFGSYLEQGVVWLLEGNAATEGAARLEQSAMRAPDIDVSAELTLMRDLEAVGCSTAAIHQAVLDYRGDLNSAAARLLDDLADNLKMSYQSLLEATLAAQSRALASAGVGPLPLVEGGLFGGTGGGQGAAAQASGSALLQALLGGAGAAGQGQGQASAAGGARPPGFSLF